MIGGRFGMSQPCQNLLESRLPFLVSFCHADGFGHPDTFKIRDQFRITQHIDGIHAMQFFQQALDELCADALVLVIGQDFEQADVSCQYVVSNGSNKANDLLIFIKCEDAIVAFSEHFVMFFRRGSLRPAHKKTLELMRKD